MNTKFILSGGKLLNLTNVDSLRVEQIKKRGWRIVAVRNYSGFDSNVWSSDDYDSEEAANAAFKALIDFLAEPNPSALVFELSKL